jgi:2',3'-cyclic-nucleotide 2'-phosphodiesterase (5'-nucleotidase family)
MRYARKCARSLWMDCRRMRGTALLLWMSLAGACQSRRPLDLRPIRDARSGLSSEIAETGTLQERLARPDLADLVLLYGAEAAGALGPCGCDRTPRGGLARIKTYSDATVERSPRAEVWLVDAGGWLDPTLDGSGQPRLDAIAANRWMVRGMGALQPAALNVGWSDLMGLPGLSAHAGGSASVEVPLVSANIEGPGIKPFFERTVGDQRVVLTGIAHNGPPMLLPAGYTQRDPVEGVKAVLEAAAVQPADFVILLSSESNEAGMVLAEAGLVDVVVDARQHRYRDPPFRAGDAVWVKAHHQTLRLGELRLGLQDGRATWALDRKIDLDTTVPSDPQLARWAREAEREVEFVRQSRYGIE